jgi:hypothetical protein
MLILIFIIVGIVYFLFRLFGPTLVGRWISSKKQQNIPVDPVDRELTQPTFYGWDQVIARMGNPNAVIALGFFFMILVAISYENEYRFANHSVEIAASILDPHGSPEVQFVTNDGQKITATVDARATIDEKQPTLPVRYSLVNPAVVKSADNLYPKTSKLFWAALFFISVGLYRRYMGSSRQSIKDWRNEI